MIGFYKLLMVISTILVIVFSVLLLKKKKSYSIICSNKPDQILIQNAKRNIYVTNGLDRPISLQKLNSCSKKSEYLAPNYTFSAYLRESESLKFENSLATIKVESQTVGSTESLITLITFYISSMAFLFIKSVDPIQNTWLIFSKQCDHLLLLHKKYQENVTASDDIYNEKYQPQENHDDKLKIDISKLVYEQEKLEKEIRKQLDDMKYFIKVNLGVCISKKLFKRLKLPTKLSSLRKINYSEFKQIVTSISHSKFILKTYTSSFF